MKKKSRTAAKNIPHKNQVLPLQEKKEWMQFQKTKHNHSLANLLGHVEVVHDVLLGDELGPSTKRHESLVDLLPCFER